MGIFSSFALGHWVGIGSPFAPGHSEGRIGETMSGPFSASCGRGSGSPLPNNGEARRWLASICGVLQRLAAAEPVGSAFLCGAAHRIETCGDSVLQAVHGSVNC